MKKVRNVLTSELLLRGLEGFTQGKSISTTVGRVRYFLREGEVYVVFIQDGERILFVKIPLYEGAPPVSIRHFAPVEDEILDEFCRFVFKIPSNSLQFAKQCVAEVDARCRVDGDLLMVCPDILMTYVNPTLEQVKKATRVNSWSIRYAPEEFHVEELHLMVLKRDARVFRVLKNPTSAACLLAVELNPFNLQFVPRELQTEEMCSIAINKNKNASRFIKI